MDGIKIAKLQRLLNRLNNSMTYGIAIMQRLQAYDGYIKTIEFSF